VKKKLSELTNNELVEKFGDLLKEILEVRTLLMGIPLYQKLISLQVLQADLETEMKKRNGAI
jgi:hypothetical protein